MKTWGGRPVANPTDLLGASEPVSTNLSKNGRDLGENAVFNPAESSTGS